MRFWVPQVAVQREGDRIQWVISAATLDEASLAQIVQLTKHALHAEAEPKHPWPKPLTCSTQPTRSQWIDRLTTVIPCLTQAQGKVVLCTRESHQFDRPLDASQWFERLRSQSPGGFQYYFQVCDLAFMGVSPECLYDRHGTSLSTEALAGTAKLEGGLDTPKENCEHDFVVRDMTEALARVCVDVRCDAVKERLAWHDLVHLKTSLTGTLKPGVTDSRIVQALHPSAAVLGYPRDKAWQWLSAFEDHSRGWYAGPVGWFDRDRAQFAVAIRCALVVADSLHLYAGAGLVHESQPDQEWQEVQNKMQHFKKTLKLGRSRPIKS
jgi:menaquinone-specific isochorismate synthase